jgi:predicted transcriptional regulator
VKTRFFHHSKTCMIINDLAKLKRALHLASQFADVHAGDNDVLGKMASELRGLIDELQPDIADLPVDEE